MSRGEAIERCWCRRRELACGQAVEWRWYDRREARAGEPSSGSGAAEASDLQAG
jgi:hypothetical protein